MKIFKNIYNQYGYRIMEIILIAMIVLIALTVQGNMKQDKINAQLLEKYNELSKK